MSKYGHTHTKVLTYLTSAGHLYFTIYLLLGFIYGTTFSPSYTHPLKGYFHFTVEQNKAQRGQASCLGLHSYKGRARLQGWANEEGVPVPL